MMSERKREEAGDRRRWHAVRTVLVASAAGVIAYVVAFAGFRGFGIVVATLLLCGIVMAWPIPMSRRWEFLPNAAWGVTAFVAASAAAHFVFLAWMPPKDGIGPTRYQLIEATALFLAGVVPAAVIAVLFGIAVKGAYLLVTRKFTAHRP